MRYTRKTPEEEGSSFIWDHQVAAHNGVQVDPLKDYSFSIIEGTSDPFTRQIKESVLIQESLDSKTYDKQKVRSLNRKYEYFQARKRPFDH